MGEEIVEVVADPQLTAILEALNLFKNLVIGDPEDEETSVSEDLTALRADVGEIKEMVGAYTGEDRPFLTTNFADYTVSEGLLLLILLALFLQQLLRLVKEGFFWLWS